MTDTLDMSKVKQVGKTYITRGGKRVTVRGITRNGTLDCSDGHSRTLYGFIFSRKGEDDDDLTDEVQELPAPVEAWGNYYLDGGRLFAAAYFNCDQAKMSCGAGGKTYRVRVEFLELAK